MNPFFFLCNTKEYILRKFLVYSDYKLKVWGPILFQPQYSSKYVTELKVISEYFICNKYFFNLNEFALMIYTKYAILWLASTTDSIVQFW